MRVKFIADQDIGDTFGISIIIDNKWAGRVVWCDIPLKRIARVSRKDMGWTGSKMQAEAGAEMLQRFYAEGKIK